MVCGASVEDRAYLGLLHPHGVQQVVKELLTVLLLVAFKARSPVENTQMYILIHTNTDSVHTRTTSRTHPLSHTQCRVLLC